VEPRNALLVLHLYPEYEHRAEFTGTIRKVMIDLAGEKHIDPEAEARMSLVEE
jgi:hypothetical protein